jgi:predicted nucleic acid-binding protein
MDLLLTLCEEHLFDWVWSDELLDEWEHVIVREKHRSAASARSVTAAVRTWFGSSRLDPAVYRHLATEHLSRDEADRVHVAACLGGRQLDKAGATVFALRAGRRLGCDRPHP